jgi:multidrug resistance efflux pump
VYVEEGQLVHVDDVLVTIDPQDDRIASNLGGRAGAKFKYHYSLRL